MVVFGNYKDFDSAATTTKITTILDLTVNVALQAVSKCPGATRLVLHIATISILCVLNVWDCPTLSRSEGIFPFWMYGSQLFHIWYMMFFWLQKNMILVILTVSVSLAIPPLFLFSKLIRKISLMSLFNTSAAVIFGFSGIWNNYQSLIYFPYISAGIFSPMTFVIFSCHVLYPPPDPGLLCGALIAIRSLHFYIVIMGLHINYFFRSAFSTAGLSPLNSIWGGDYKLPPPFGPPAIKASLQDSNWPTHKISWQSGLSLRRYLQNNTDIVWSLIFKVFCIFSNFEHQSSPKVWKICKNPWDFLRHQQLGDPGMLL